jgi:hypothetical protein
MGRKFWLVLAFLCVSWMMISPKTVRGEDIEHRLGIGLNWPGLSVKYGLSSKFAIEGRFQTEENIAVMGPRLYYSIKNYDRLTLFTGLEADYVTFTGEVSKGTGIAGEVFVGCEYFISGNLSLLLDIGPAFISITDTDSSQSEVGFDSVANLGINYYFGK